MRNSSVCNTRYGMVRSGCRMEIDATLRHYTFSQLKLIAVASDQGNTVYVRTCSGVCMIYVHTCTGVGSCVSRVHAPPEQLFFLRTAQASYLSLSFFQGLKITCKYVHTCSGLCMYVCACQS